MRRRPASACPACTCALQTSTLGGLCARLVPCRAAGVSGDRITDIEFTNNLIFGHPATVLHGINANFTTDMRVINNVFDMHGSATTSMVVAADCVDVIVRDNRVNKPTSISGSATTCYAWNNEGDGPRLMGGAGDPEGEVTAGPGSIWMRDKLHLA